MKNSKSARDQIQESNPEFLEEVASLGKEALEHRIAELAKAEAAVNKAKEDDSGLQDLKDQVKIASAPYSETKKAIKLKIKLLLELLEDKG